MRMEKRIFEIVSNAPVARDTFRLELASPGYEFSGEFVDVAVEGFYLRRPISVCDCGDGRITLIYKTVGEGTKALSHMREGQPLELLTGLGKGFDADACRSSALLVGGGLGAAPLHLLCRRLVSSGKKVTAVLGFNTAADVVLEDEFDRMCPGSFTVVTMDGSRGMKGLVTDAIATLAPGYDFFYTCGPLVMMKAVCRMLEGPGQASLEERMGCGAGFCYGCSCETLLGPKRVCKDGPVFNKEEIIW